MKTFIVESQTNHDLMVHIVNADDAAQANSLALAAGAWEGCVVHELDIHTPGVVHKA